jgi:hypothetical protein
MARRPSPWRDGGGWDRFRQKDRADNRDRDLARWRAAALTTSLPRKVIDAADPDSLDEVR